MIYIKYEKAMKIIEMASKEDFPKERRNERMKEKEKKQVHIQTD